MAGTYGEPGKNPYTIPKIVGQYSNVVNASTGVTQVYRKSSQFQYTSIGTYNPLTKKFTPDPNASLSKDDIQILSRSSNARKAITDAAIKTATAAGLSQTNAQQLISPNTAPSGGTPTPQAPNQGGATPPAATPLPGPNDTSLTANPSQSLEFSTPAGLRYPKDITSKQDRVKFQAAELLARSSPSGEGSLSGGFAFEFPKPSMKSVDGPVIIAIQAPISDQNSVDWGPNTINAVDSALYNASYKLMEGGDASQQVSDFLKNIIGSAGDYSGRIQRLLAGQAAGVNNILARTDNVVLNPNLELLFQGPQLRPFAFSFKMSARNQPEANEIRAIINYFKYHMAVRQESGLFLKAPHVFKIQYEKGENELHPGINLIAPIVREDKACALTNFSVDYTPLGSYMTYPDGTMVSYTLNLQFQEITPILDTDYKDILTTEGSPVPIGY